MFTFSRVHSLSRICTPVTHRKFHKLPKTMSGSDCENSESATEENTSNKLTVFVVTEGDTSGKIDEAVGGTLERHRVSELQSVQPSASEVSKVSTGGPDRAYSKGLNASDETVVFESEEMKSSTRVDDLSRSWHEGETRTDGITDLVSRIRRSHSWGAEQPDDGSSEVRLLRERLLRTQALPQPTAVRSFTHRQRLTLISLALVDFMSFCSMSIMAPFFPREATEKGMSDTMSGFVFSFYALIMFLSAPVFGKVLPVIGAKFMFMSGMFVAGTCNILFGTLELMPQREIFTVFCFMIRGLEALGASAYSTASYVFVVNTFPTNIGSVLGILETFVGLGMSVGPAIGALLYSVGGFGLPFYVLGVAMVLAVPVNCCLLIDDPEYTFADKSGSIMQLVKIPSIIITGLVIIIVSNIWAFLDPTLEPHLRQFGLSTQQIGLIFLLFSALYAIFSPIWGCLADRVHNHWCMMVWGLFLCTVGLLLLGPSPFLPLKSEVWLNLVALSILGVSVALTLLPTFQGVLSSSIYEGGCPEALTTYSVVAGVWSCCYSLGEVLGPALGSAVASYYGFPLCTTIMAAMCFTMAVITLTFFSLKESGKLAQSSASLSGSLPYSEATWNSNELSVGSVGVGAVSPLSVSDTSPLTSSYKAVPNYGTHTSKRPGLEKRRKSGAASVADAVAYVLMFKFLTRALARLFTPAAGDEESCRAASYQNYTTLKPETLIGVKV